MPIDGIARIFDGITLGKQIGNVHLGAFGVLLLVQGKLFIFWAIAEHNELTLIFTSA